MPRCKLPLAASPGLNPGQPQQGLQRGKNPTLLESVLRTEVLQRQASGGSNLLLIPLLILWSSGQGQLQNSGFGEGVFEAAWTTGVVLQAWFGFHWG